jgi:hypothetical protein
MVMDLGFSIDFRALEWGQRVTESVHQKIDSGSNLTGLLVIPYSVMTSITSSTVAYLIWIYMSRTCRQRRPFPKMEV